MAPAVAADGAGDLPLPVTRVFRAPEPDIVAKGATPTMLAEFGLPPRPDDPALLKLWERLLVPLPTIVQPIFEPDRGHRPGGLDPGPSNGAVAGGLGNSTRWGRSSNWSGAYIAARDGERFSAVWGSWTVSEPEPPEGVAAATRPPGGQYRCSTWIGLDGHRRHSRSLPQMGTTRIVTVPGDGVMRREIVAWHQWWVRDEADPHPMNIVNFPLRAQDQVACALWVTGPNRVAFAMKNLRADLLMVWEVEHQAAPVEGSAAEWIVERPTEVGTTAVYELAKYGTERFTGCAAESRRALGDARGTCRDLAGARLVRMYKPFDGPQHRTAFISVPKKLGDAEIEVSYRGVASA